MGSSAKFDAPDSLSSESQTTHFGFSQVATQNKAGLVKSLFERVADRYDLMNDLMSGGLHRLWKASLIDQIAPKPHHSLLDVAGGTGDISEAWLRRGGGPVTLLDMNLAMIKAGMARRLDKGIIPNDSLKLMVGNAESLPFADNSFDNYTIAFGLRNVTHIPLALAEAARILKPGGRFFCLEFSAVILPWLKPIYDRYSFQILPWLGEKIAHDRPAYQYLAESIRRFPPQTALLSLMEQAGLRNCHFRNMSGGIVALHQGWKL